MPSANVPSQSDSERISPDLARSYIDNRVGMETLSQAVMTADQERMMAMNRRALAADYERQRQRLDAIAGTRTEGSQMAEDDTEFRVDSPQTTTINNAGIPSWVPLLTAAAMGLAGAGGAAAMLSRPQPAPAPVIQQPAPAVSGTDTDTRYRVTVE
jgi:hypothetical protein